MLKLIIPGTLPGLNEYTKACRANKYAGANLKQQTEESIMWQIRSQLKNEKFESVILTFAWYEINKRRDLDNIAFAKKFILDALQATGTLSGDGWGTVKGFSDEFYIDKHNPRVEVVIQEREGAKA